MYKSISLTNIRIDIKAKFFIGLKWSVIFGIIVHYVGLIVLFIPSLNKIPLIMTKLWQILAKFNNLTMNVSELLENGKMLYIAVSVSFTNKFTLT
jgi:hypothetical protein